MRARRGGVRGVSSGAARERRFDCEDGVKGKERTLESVYHTLSPSSRDVRVGGESVEKHCFRTPACDGPPSPEQKDPYPELIDVPWIHTPPHTFSEMAVRALSDGREHDGVGVVGE